MSYVSTNIRLQENVLKELKIKAAKENKSLAQLIRESVDYILGREKKDLTNAQFKKDSLWNIVGMFENDISDGSVNHDRDLYGEK